MPTRFSPFDSSLSDRSIHPAICDCDAPATRRTGSHLQNAVRIDRERADYGRTDGGTAGRLGRECTSWVEIENGIKGVRSYIDLPWVCGFFGTTRVVEVARLAPTHHQRMGLMKIAQQNGRTILSG